MLQIRKKNSVLDYIRYKQLKWYGHVGEMNEESLPKKCWNGIDLEEQEKEDFDIRGCRK